LCAKRVFRRTGILGERAETAHAQVAVDLITRLKGLDTCANGFDTAGDISAEDTHPRREETAEHALRRRPTQ